MSNEKMREEFKDWHDKQTGLDVKFDEYGTAYCSKDMTTENMLINSLSNATWQAWQASRSAQCIELPLAFSDERATTYLTRVTSALDAAGVRYK